MSLIITIILITPNFRHPSGSYVKIIIIIIIIIIIKDIPLLPAPAPKKLRPYGAIQNYRYVYYYYYYYYYICTSVDLCYERIKCTILNICRCFALFAMICHNQTTPNAKTAFEAEAKARHLAWRSY